MLDKKLSKKKTRQSMTNLSNQTSENGDMELPENIEEDKSIIMLSLE